MYYTSDYIIELIMDPISTFISEDWGCGNQECLPEVNDFDTS